MIEYIYFVKCPNCEDEHFSFFNEAKEYALGCLSQKPVITQIEVDRNDFGECVDSNDLGTIWSWEEVMKDVDSEPTVFSKSDTFDYPECSADLLHEEDPEFASLDNSLDFVPDNFRKPVPADMTIDALVEEMEENEDTVECKWCEDLFEKSECRYEVNLGWLCSRCQQAIMSRGETLTFRENSYWDFLDESAEETKDLTESTDPAETVEFEYDKLTITLDGPMRDVDDWDEIEHTDSYTLVKDKNDVLEALSDYITDEDIVALSGDPEVLNDDTDAYYGFLEAHFDTLFEKYYKNLLEYYEEEALDEFRDSTSYEDVMSDRRAAYDDWRYDAWRDEQLFREGSSKPKSVLEELEDGDTFKKRLTTCPECGTLSYDPAEHYCINCGLNL